jgi:hypothetical protein
MPARQLTDRHPFEVYLITFGFVSSAPGALGITGIPPSINALLDGWSARLWVIGLTVGCGMVLVGLAWKRPRFPKVSVTGLLWERIGLIIVGISCGFYAVAAWRLTGDAAFIPIGIVSGFGLACFAQANRIGRVLKSASPS